jgi:hypothetical protein
MTQFHPQNDAGRRGNAVNELLRHGFAQPARPQAPSSGPWPTWWIAQVSVDDEFGVY